MTTTASAIEQSAAKDAIEVERPEGPTGWFNRLVRWHLARRAARPARPRVESNESDRARSLIRRACIKAAASGAASGSVSTVAGVLTAQTEGIASFVMVPAAAAAIGREGVAVQRAGESEGKNRGLTQIDADTDPFHHLRSSAYIRGSISRFLWPANGYNCGKWLKSAAV